LSLLTDWFGSVACTQFLSQVKACATGTMWLSGLIALGILCWRVRECGWLLIAALVAFARSKVVIGVHGRHGPLGAVAEARQVMVPAAARAQRGAAPGLVEALPLVPYRDDGREASCAVCLDEFAGEQHVRQLPCGHRFHAPCIDQWLARSTRCPLCSRDVAPLATCCGRAASTSSDAPVRRRRWQLQAHQSQV